MSILLIRHTQPKIENGICYGQTDVPLLDTYLQDFNKIKEELSAYNLKDYNIYTSPLQRCTHLAEYLFGNKVQIDTRLMELHFGDWEMKPWDTIPQKDIEAWMNNIEKFQFPNGESVHEMGKRIKQFLEEISNQNVVLITHKGVYRWLKYLHEPYDKNELFQAEISYGELKVI